MASSTSVDGPSEESPLLATREHEARSPSSSRWDSWTSRFRLQSAYLIIPVLFGSSFAAVITTTPTIYILRQLVCRLWLAAHDPDSLPRGGSNPSDDQCNISGVDQAFSVAITALAIIDGLGGIITAGIVSHFAMRYGRKPVILVLISLTALSTACFLAAVDAAVGPLHDGLLLTWIIIAAFSGQAVVSLTCNMYVVDMTEPSQRTFVLSVGAGFAALGTAPTYWLGGYISHRSSVVTVFWWKLITAVAIILYVLIVLPESFSAQKREASRRETELRNREAPPRSHNKLISVLRRPLDVIESILEPLRYLKPSHDAGRGRHNFRLLTIAISLVLTSLAVEYIPEAWLIYTTVRFQFKSEDLGLALSAFAFSKVIWLAAFVPAILRCGRPFYNKRWSHQHSLPRSSINDDPDLAFEDSPTRAPAPQVDADMASHFDVYIAIASSALWTLVIIFMGLAYSQAAAMWALILLSLGTGHDPAFKSVSVASADPLHSAQVLSAMAIVGSVGRLFAPIVFGSILSSTIATTPQLVFFVSSATVAIGGAFLFLVRDSDRHVKTSTGAE